MGNSTVQARDRTANPLSMAGGKLVSTGWKQFQAAENPWQKLTGTLMAAGGGALWTAGQLRSVASPLIQRGAEALSSYAQEHEVILPQSAEALAPVLIVVGSALSMPLVLGATDDVVEAAIESIL